MAAFDMTSVIGALKDAGFADEQLTLLKDAGEDLRRWEVDDYVEAGFSRVEGGAARTTVRDNFGVIREEQGIEIPDAPTYLKNTGRLPVIGKPLDDGTITIKTAAQVGDYDAHDPLQFVKVGDQRFRWDGKRSVRDPEGRMHEIAIVDHRIVNKIPVPDMDQARAAEMAGLQWFHRGYGCWISNEGKPLSVVPRDKLNALRGVVERTTSRAVA